jgi:hypothetical protein
VNTDDRTTNNLTTNDLATAAVTTVAGEGPELPAEVAIDAWPGTPAHGELDPAAKNWGARRGLPPSQAGLAFDAPADPRQWAHEDVGYGILLRDSPDREWSEAKVTGVDAPEAVRRILAERPGTVLLHWSPELGDRYLRRYYADKTFNDPLVGLSVFGTGKGRLPRYVLIAASPELVPWSVQYSLSVRHAVGRLPFDGDELGPYVDALLDGEHGWAAHDVDVMSPVLWTVDHGPTDITRLMHAALTSPLDKAFTGTLTGLRHLVGTDATVANLVSALKAKPAVVVTSSHGATPLDPEALRADLGLPVAQDHSTVPLDRLATAIPAGAVWFAQACCSAGSTGQSSYRGLLKEGSTAWSVVEAVAANGSVVAPAPLALLARKKPVRAVLGHVEPTFDWTLRDDQTGQKLGGSIVAALSSNLHHGMPLGLAFQEYREGIGVITTQWAKLAEQLNANDTAVLPRMTRLRLTAWDRQSLVLLGDPTVTLPPLP